MIFITKNGVFYYIFWCWTFLILWKQLSCLVKFWDMAIVRAAKISSQKWHKIERQSSSNFFPQNYLSGPEVSKNQEKFEKNRDRHSSFDFFLVFRPLMKKIFVLHFFQKKISKIFFYYLSAYYIRFWQYLGEKHFFHGYF